MLLEFQVENYLSFKENAILSMIAGSSRELSDSIIIKDKYRILPSAAIYGANASGKSNFLNAIGFMKKFVFDSARESRIGDEIDVKGFKLSSDCDGKPSLFEITFIVQDVYYNNRQKDIVFRYGFEVTRTRVHSEWLFGRFTAQESRLFVRQKDEIKIGEKFKEGRQVYKAVGKIRETSLFLSLIASIKGENAPFTDSIIHWFEKLQDLSKVGDHNFYAFTADLMSNEEMKKKIVQAFCLADICIEDLTIEEKIVDLTKVPLIVRKDLEQKGVDPKNLYRIAIKSVHQKYNTKKAGIGIETFDFDKEESDGSKKFFALIGPVLDALQHGLVLVIDEIDARLHPLICDELISLFNSKKSNKNNAQLIFAIHNPLIMNRKKLRRDQIYFTEKDKYGESELYSLLDYKKVRNDASYDKDYLLGKYGAIPCLGDFETFLSGDF
jgi:AAA15 family ATPase/GTPase